MKFWIERPVATTMIFIGLLLLGGYSLFHIPLELAPTEDYPELCIDAAWPGISPEAIQAVVTAPLEEYFSALKGLRTIRSTSMFGMSRIILVFDEDVDMRFVELSVRESVSRQKRSLPPGVKLLIRPSVPEEFRSRAFMRLACFGPYSPQDLGMIIQESIKAPISSIQGIKRIDIQGGSESVIKVVLDPDKMKALEISPLQISDRLSRLGRIFPSSGVVRGRNDLVLKITQEVSGLHDLKQIRIKHSGSCPVRLSHVARIFSAHENAGFLYRINRVTAVRITVHKERDAGALRLGRMIRNKLVAIQSRLPPDICFRIIDNESAEISRRLKELVLLGGIILGIVFLLILIVFRKAVPSCLVLSSVLFSVLISFNLVFWGGFSLNILILGGMVLGFGFFVDNAVVVMDNILRSREKGLSPYQAALYGSKEIFLPVLAANLTTLSVFFTFAYFQGRLRIYYLPLAVIMTAALLVSFFVSFTVIPAASCRILKKPRLTYRGKAIQLLEKTLQVGLQHPVLVLLLVVILFYAGYKEFDAHVPKREFFRWSSVKNLSVFIGMPPGAGIERTDEAVKMFEKTAAETEGDITLSAIVAGEQGWIEIRFPPELEHSAQPLVLKEKLIQLAARTAGISVSVHGFEPLGYQTRPVAGPAMGSRIDFYGYDLNKIRRITANLEAMLRKYPRIDEIRVISSLSDWWRNDCFEYTFGISRNDLIEHSVDSLSLTSWLELWLREGSKTPRKMTIGGKESNLIMTLPRSGQMAIHDLRHASLRTQEGTFMMLGDFATFEKSPMMGSIDREDQRFHLTVLWDYRGPKKAADHFRKTVFARLNLPPGFSASIEKPYIMTEGEQKQLFFALWMSLAIMYMILASLYESFILPLYVLLAVPLSFIGVFFIFVLSGHTFDSSAYIGLLLLGGMVINNSILLVSQINLKREQGISLDRAVLETVLERIRPLWLTTGTTVLGVMPLLLLQGRQGYDPVWSTLALSTAGGLISSAVFFPVVIPIIYRFGERLRTRHR